MAIIPFAAAEACERVLGPARARWVRCQLPQWEGPPAYNSSFEWQLARMRQSGAHDGQHLAAGDRLCFAKAFSLLAVLMQMVAPRV